MSMSDFPHTTGQILLQLNVIRFQREQQQQQTTCWKLSSVGFLQLIMDGAAHQPSCWQPTTLQDSVSQKAILETICLVTVNVAGTDDTAHSVAFHFLFEMYDLNTAVRIKLHKRCIIVPANEVVQRFRGFTAGLFPSFSVYSDHTGFVTGFDSDWLTDHLIWIHRNIINFSNSLTCFTHTYINVHVAICSLKLSNDAPFCSSLRVW